jgi:hypothetical protein
MKGSKHSGNTKGKKALERYAFSAERRNESPEVIRRILSRYDPDAASTGNILGYFIGSVGVQSATEWSLLAAAYAEFRVRGIKVQLCPVLFETVVSPPTAAAFTAAYPGPVVSANYDNGVGPTTLSTSLAQDGATAHGCNSQVMTQIASWDVNPTAKLWSACGVALPVERQFGVLFSGSVPALVAINGAITHYAFVQFDVEFRGRTV